MKRLAISLTMTLLLCGGAAAQSNVTLYGIVDVGVQWNKQYSTASGQQEGAVERGQRLPVRQSARRARCRSRSAPV